MLTSASALGFFLVGIIVGVIFLWLFARWSMRQPGALSGFVSGFLAAAAKVSPMFSHDGHPICPLCALTQEETGHAVNRCAHHAQGGPRLPQPWSIDLENVDRFLHTLEPEQVRAWYAVLSPDQSALFSLLLGHHVARVEQRKREVRV